MFDSGGVLTRPVEGSRILGLPPHECLFVDDDPELVAAARSLGYHGVTLERDADAPDGVEVIATLDRLVALVDG